MAAVCGVLRGEKLAVSVCLGMTGIIAAIVVLNIKNK